MGVTPANVRALEGAKTRPGRAGGNGSMGDQVYLASDGDWEAGDANVSAALATSKGVVVAVAKPGETTFVNGDRITVCYLGPVGGYDSMTPGARQYVSATVGLITETAPSGAGTWTQAIGYAESAGVLMVDPGIQAPVSNS